MRRWSTIFSHLIESEDSLPCSQHPATCPCPAPDPACSFPSRLFKLRFNIILQSTHAFQVISSILGFPVKPLCAFLFSSVPVTCPAHLIFLDVIAVIVFVEEYKPPSSLLRSFLHPSCTFFLSAVFSSTLDHCSSFRVTILNG